MTRLGSVWWPGSPMLGLPAAEASPTSAGLCLRCNQCVFEKQVDQKPFILAFWVILQHKGAV